MTETQKISYRPSRRILNGLAWRIALVLVATMAVVFELPALVRAPLSVVAAVVVADYFARRYRRGGPLETALTVLGAIVAILALLGLVLGLLPAGITTVSWGVGVGVVEIVALVALTYWRDPSTEMLWGARRPSTPAVLWGLAIVGVLAVAITGSVISSNANYIAPLALSSETSNGSAVITVSSGTDGGPYDLYLVTETGRRVLASDITVGPGQDSTLTIDLPVNARETVQLVQSGTTDSVRELILDTTGTNPDVTG